MSTLPTYSMFIGGKWVQSVNGKTYTAVNPATGEPIGLVPEGTREDARLAIAAAREAQPRLAKMSVWERARLCLRLADAVEKRQTELAHILSLEQGHVYHTESLPEVDETILNFRNAAEHIKWMETSVIPVQDPNKRVITIRQPRGVYAVLTPFNFPMAIPSEYLPYALAAGNAVVWVPSPTTAICAIKLMEALVEGGLPEGFINLVTGFGPVVGDEIVANPGTDAVAMTGGSATGKKVAERAAGKPLLLELGGNGPTVILDDVDPVQVAHVIAPACFFAAGQVCSAAERIFVHRSLKEPLLEELAKIAQSHRLGDPFDPQTTMGPLNNMGVVNKMDAHLADALQKGAAIVTGGKRPEGMRGYFYEPTVLTDFIPDSLVNLEETFGPIAPAAAFEDEEEVWRYIDACDLGLVSAIFTRDIRRAWHWAERLKTGIVVVNDYTNYWETHIPFGGMAGTRSGIGRLGGKYTLMEMTDLKTIAFHLG
jgi:succinate-semialdehyde dehydrogenase/glutarate-semialdehyde dehydrogenase